MKKKVLSVIILLAFFTISYGTLFTVDKVYSKKIEDKYQNGVGDLLSEQKNQGLELQKGSIKKGDNLLLYGSSELSGATNPFHPTHFFKNKAGGYQVNLIGRGYSQSIIHAINFLALGEQLKDQKVGIIISPQWFTKKGLQSSEFNMNFSELQFYSFMFDKKIDKNVKVKMAKRIGQLAMGAQELGQIKTFANLYVYGENTTFAKGVLWMTMPYYKIKYELLKVKDKIETDKILKGYKENPQVDSKVKKSFQWEEAKKQAVEIGKKETNNNEFYIGNSYYDTYIKEKLESDKGMYKNDSFLTSPEYEDFNMLLDVCKSLSIKPIFISVPVHGKWYDYCEFNKTDREEYYKKVTEMVTSHGFEIADLSKSEYEPYFLRDIMHLGWKGWVYVNEALDQYYHEDRK